MKIQTSLLNGLTTAAAVLVILEGLRLLIAPRRRTVEAPAANFFSRLADDAVSAIMDDPAATLGTVAADIKLKVIGPPAVNLPPPAPSALPAPPAADYDEFFTGA